MRISRFLATEEMQGHETLNIVERVFYVLHNLLVLGIMAEGEGCGVAVIYIAVVSHT